MWNELIHQLFASDFFFIFTIVFKQHLTGNVDFVCCRNMHGRHLIFFGRKGNAAATWWESQLIFIRAIGCAKVWHFATVCPCGSCRNGNLQSTYAVLDLFHAGEVCMLDPDMRDLGFVRLQPNEWVVNLLNVWAINKMSCLWLLPLVLFGSTIFT